jgi:hypothetical protein
MPKDSSKPEASFGFLSSLKSAEYGFFGGYLIVSPLGRPLEFHCTSPVNPSRAQEILYGPTLYTYLLGDQIAAALLQAAKLSPRLIVTDEPAMLSARMRAMAPMTLLVPACSTLAVSNVAADESGARDCNADISGTRTCGQNEGRFQVGDYELQMPVGFESEMGTITDLAAVLTQHVELREPFGRIHEAIREAQRIGGRTVEANGEAA